MVRGSTPALWYQAFGESALGRRGVVKTANLWLPLALLLASKPTLGGASDAIACGWIFVAVFCWTQACILGNDIADAGDDVTSGKLRWIARLHSTSGYLVVVLLSVTGLYSAYMAGKQVVTLVVFALALALGLLYSFRPLRLKERGTLGLWAYSFSAMLAFVATPFTVLAHSEWRTFVVLAAAVFFDKWTNLHFHQLIDYTADRISNAQTYAVVAGEERARKTLKWAAAAAVFLLVGVLALVIVLQREGWLWHGLVCVAVIALIGIYAKAVRRKGKVSSLMRELPWQYLALTYSVLRVLPVLLFVSLSLAAPAMWLVLAVVVSVLAGESLYSFRYRYD